MYSNNKAIGPVIASGLLLVVAIVAVVTFQTWFNSYSIGIFSNVETQSGDSVGNTQIDNVLGTNLYFNNGGKNNLTLSSIKVDGNNCVLSNDQLSPGLNILNLTNCTSGISGKTEVLVVTNKGVYSKNLILNFGTSQEESEEGNETLPTILFQANASTILNQTDVNLSWTTTLTTSCFGFGDWSGSKSLNGSEVISNLSSDSSFNLTCSDGSNNYSSLIEVSIDLVPCLSGYENFTYTGLFEVFSLPENCGGDFEFYIWGAGGAGGGASGAYGGGGGYSYRKISLDKNNGNLIVIVGGGGQSAGGYNGGGGGGYSGIFNGSLSQGNTIVLAGGGGGGGGWGGTRYGGGGGGSSGQNGNGNGAGQGFGGTQSAGGAAGVRAPYNSGTAGSALQGGAGADSRGAEGADGNGGIGGYGGGARGGSPIANNYPGGGGGGGYYGGGGGAEWDYGGGGGGSGYAPYGITTQATSRNAANNTQDYYNNNVGLGGTTTSNGNPGFIRIQWDYLSALKFQTNDSMVLNGSSVNITWEFLNYDSCEASGGWSGTKEDIGSEIINNLTENTTFYLNCSDLTQGSVMKNLSVIVLNDFCFEYNFTYTGSVQYFEVPQFCTWGEFHVWGAGGAGGGASGAYGGGGGYSYKNFSLVEGSTLAVVIGGGGQSAGGYNGGGGGGYSGIFNSTVSFGNSLILAGGGGGGGGWGGSRYGGGGGGSSGQNGNGDGTGQGFGGSQVAGGAAGVKAGYNTGTAGSALQGGAGADSRAGQGADGNGGNGGYGGGADGGSPISNIYPGGGGGGGYYGGGGGAEWDYGGGGGGSGYAPSGITTQATSRTAANNTNSFYYNNSGLGGTTTSNGNHGYIVAIFGKN